MHPALLYLPGTRLSLPELTAARLDGHVVELGDAYVPADTVEGVDARAASVAAGIPDRMGACGPTAAWIHGAGLLRLRCIMCVGSRRDASGPVSGTP